MKMISLFVALLLGMSLLVACSSEEVLILKYKIENNCPDPLVRVPITSNYEVKDFTFCAKYNFMFLRKGILMALGTEAFFWMYNFEDQKGFVGYDGGYYFFDFQTQDIKPEKWQHICFAISMKYIKIVFNGKILSNDKADDLVTKGTKNTTLWLGGMIDEIRDWERRDFNSSDAKKNLHGFVGSITDAHLWNGSLEIDHLISITLNGKSSDVIPVPDLFSWNDLEFGTNTACFEYLSVEENDALLQNNPPVKLMLMENLHDFDSSNYLCQAYGGKLFAPKNEEDFKKVRSLMYQNSNNCKDAYLGIKKLNDVVVDLNGNSISFVKWGKSLYLPLLLKQKIHCDHLFYKTNI